MSLPKFIDNLLSNMHYYQKKNEIKKQCITNVQYCYDSIISQGFNAKAKAVIAIYKNNEEQYISTIHMVIELDNEIIIDPSYEISSIQECYYCDTIKRAIQVLSNNFKPQEVISNMIKLFLQFKQIENEINTNKFVICNKDFYNNQHNFCMLMMN